MANRTIQNKPRIRAQGRKLCHKYRSVIVGIVGKVCCFVSIPTSVLIFGCSASAVNVPFECFVNKRILIMSFCRNGNVSTVQGNNLWTG